MTAWVPEVHLGLAASEQMLAELAFYLRSSGFTEGEAVKTLGAASIDDLVGNSVLYALDSFKNVERICRTAPGVLVQLFIRNGEVRADAYNQMLSPGLRSALDALNLIEVNNERASARASITPCFSMYFLSDPLFRCSGLETAEPELTLSDEVNFVMPPHASSLLLHRNVTPGCGRLLDLGCGCGVLGLAVAQQRQEVLGIDINQRAVAYSSLNSALNERRTEFRLGNFLTDYGGVIGFDHVIFNAPISSPHRQCIRETGSMTAKEIVAGIVDTSAKVVVPGGLVQVLVIVEVGHQHDSASDVIAQWMRTGVTARRYQVSEVRSSTLGIPARAISRGRIQPGCLLVDDEEDAALLLAHLRCAGIREVVPAIVSILVEG